MAAGNDVDDKIKTLASVGRRHSTKHHIDREFFACLGEALLWVVQTALGEYWGADFEEAWIMGYSRCLDIILKAYS